MRIFRQLIVATFLVASCRLSASASASYVAADKGDIDKKLAAIADYKEGLGTEAIVAVESLIRESQSRPDQRKYIELQLTKMLQSGVSPEAKLFICRQLWYIGTADSVPAVAGLLLDEQTADMACYAIGQNQSPEAGNSLRDALGKVVPRVQIRIINLLGDRRDQPSAEAMAKLVFGADRDVAEAAIAALGKIGGPRATKILAEARVKGDSDMRLAATDAYLRCAEDLAAEGKKEQAAGIYRELTGSSEAPFVRSAAVKGLADIGGADGVAVVVAALRDEDRMVRTTARGCVRTMRGDGVSSRFAAELSKTLPGERVLLLGALADRGDPAVMPAIVKSAADADLEIRKAALQALGKLGDASSVELLARAATEAAASEERLAALNSLAILRGDGVDDAIVKSMLQSEPAVRARLIEVLYSRNAVSAVGPLLKEAAGSDPKVRIAAFKALGRLAEPRDLLLLVAVLLDLPDDEGRREGERAITAVARKVADRTSGANAVLDALQVENRVPARCSLLRVLGGIADDRSLEALKAALKDSDPEVHDTAVRELANWPNAAAAEALVGVFCEAQSQIHRLLALRGFVRLLSLPSGGRSVRKVLEMYKQAMSQVRLPQEKKLLLGGLASVSHPEALEMAQQYAGDDAVKAEAILATIQVARRICASHCDIARAAAQNVLSMTADEAVREQARGVLSIIAGLGDYITSWQVCGPYGEQTKDYQQLFDVVFAPERSDVAVGGWQVMPAGDDPNRPWVLEMSRLFAGEQQVAYLRTWVHSEKQQQLRLEMGSDDGIKVWLNGTVVHANNVTRTLVPACDRVDVSLRQGWNDLLVKVTQNSGSWQFCARLRSPDGAGAVTAKIDCMHEAN